MGAHSSNLIYLPACVQEKFAHDAFEKKTCPPPFPTVSKVMFLHHAYSRARPIYKHSVVLTSLIDIALNFT